MLFLVGVNYSDQAANVGWRSSAWNSKLIAPATKENILRQLRFVPFIPTGIPQGYHLRFAEKVYVKIPVGRQALHLAYAKGDAYIDIVEYPNKGIYGNYYFYLGEVERSRYFRIDYEIQGDCPFRFHNLDVKIFSSVPFDATVDRFKALFR